jgi:hypothetical protein
MSNTRTDSIICPNCTCRFIAVPEDVQQRLAELERSLNEAVRERDEARAHRRVLFDEDLKARCLKEQEGEITALTAYAGECSEALGIFVGCAYKVSVEINPRGYNWSEAYLDQALPIARAALAKNPHLKAESVTISEENVSQKQGQKSDAAFPNPLTERPSDEWYRRKIAETGDAPSVIGAAHLTACPKCGLEAKTLLHPHCQHADCPVRSTPAIGSDPHLAPPNATGCSRCGGPEVDQHLCTETLCRAPLEDRLARYSEELNWGSSDLPWPTERDKRRRIAESLRLAVFDVKRLRELAKSVTSTRNAP